MKYRFKPGQEVRCVYVAGAPELKLNQVYTIMDVKPSYTGVRVYEQWAIGEEYNGYFKSLRFRPLEDEDSDWVEEVLEKVMDGVEEVVMNEVEEREVVEVE